MNSNQHEALLNDEELLTASFDTDAVTIEAKQHLAQCEVCQKRVEKYRSLNRFLLSKLYRRQCITGMEVSLYSADLVSLKERRRIEAHLRQCPLCTKEVEETKKALME